MVNRGFDTLDEKGTKTINFILLLSKSTSPKALLSQGCSGNWFLF